MFDEVVLCTRSPAHEIGARGAGRGELPQPGLRPLAVWDPRGMSNCRIGTLLPLPLCLPCAHEL